MEAKVEEQHNIRAWADQRVERSREFGLNQNTKQLPPIYPPLILASSSSLDLSTLSVQRIAGSVIHDDLCNRHTGNVWWILEYDDTFQSIKSIRMHWEWGIGDKDDEKRCQASSLQWPLGDRSVFIRIAMSPLSKWGTSCTLPTQTNSQLHSKVLLIINTINVLQRINWTQLYIWNQLISWSLDTEVKFVNAITASGSVKFLPAV